MRIVETYLASHPEVAQLTLDPAPERAALERFMEERGAPPGTGVSLPDSAERKLDDRGAERPGADRDAAPGWGLATDERECDPAQLG